jgi:hypothetical protein
MTEPIDIETTDTGDTRARSAAVPWLLAASGWVALAATLLPAAGPLRVIVTFGFLLVCPGLALVRLLERPDLLEEFVVGLALSMSLAVTVSVAMAVGHWWHPGWGLALLALLTTVAGVAGSGAGLARIRGGGPGATDEPREVGGR